MAECPSCGADNPDYAFYCGKCSASLRNERGEIITPSSGKSKRQAAVETPGLVPQGTPQQAQKAALCRQCGRQLIESATFCPYCGSPIWGSASTQEGWTTFAYGADTHGDRASGTLVLGGIMATLAGILALGQGLLLTVVTSSFYGDYVSGSGAVCLCGGLDVLFGLGSIAGGFFAMRRNSFGLSLAGAVVGMLGIGFGFGFLFGLIATVCIAVSRAEFLD